MYAQQRHLSDTSAAMFAFKPANSAPQKSDQYKLFLAPALRPSRLLHIYEIDLVEMESVIMQIFARPQVFFDIAEYREKLEAMINAIRLAHPRLRERLASPSAVVLMVDEWFAALRADSEKTLELVRQKSLTDSYDYLRGLRHQRIAQRYEEYKKAS